MGRTSLLSLLLLLLLSACDQSEVAGPGATGDEATSLATSITVVMSGLDSPRGLAFGPEGGLYVAEAGIRTIAGPCTPIPRGQNCYSGTGAVSRLWRGRQERVATGLPSAFNPGFDDVVGPHDVSFQGRGGLHVTSGWGGPPDARAGLGALGTDFGAVLQVTPSGRWRAVADVAAFEGAANPGGGAADSNPYGLLAEPGRLFVVDAGGNSLVEVRPDGSVSLVATFPSTPVPPGPFNPPFTESEAVPTEVVRGPDGALYVSTLSGVPFLPGAARIYRVAAGGLPEVYVGGFTTITDFDWAPDGTLYVVQFASAPFLGGPGALVRVTPDGTRTTITSDLLNPTGVVVGPDGAVYVSNKGVVDGMGEVLRIVP